MIYKHCYVAPLPTLFLCHLFLASIITVRTQLIMAPSYGDYHYRHEALLTVKSVHNSNINSSAIISWLESSISSTKFSQRRVQSMQEFVSIFPTERHGRLDLDHVLFHPINANL